MMVGAAGTSLSLTRQREWKDGGQFWKFCIRRDLEDTNDARELRNAQLVFGAGSLTLSACRASGAAYVIFFSPCGTCLCSSDVTNVDTGEGELVTIPDGHAAPAKGDGDHSPFVGAKSQKDTGSPSKEKKN